MTGQEVCAPSWGRVHGERSGTTNDDDSELVARFQRGETRVFDSLFARHQDYVYRIVYGIVGSVEEARDVTQEVFVQVYRALPGFRRGARFATWLYRIAVNRAVDAARGSRRWRFLSLLDEPGALLLAGERDQEPEAVFERQLNQEQIQAILMRCSLMHRQTLALRYYKDMSLDEIAETLGCSLSAAKVRLHRARLAFKAQYVDAHGEPNEMTTDKSGHNETERRTAASESEYGASEPQKTEARHETRSAH